MSVEMVLNGRKKREIICHLELFLLVNNTNVANKTTILVNSLKNGNNEQLNYTCDGIDNVGTIKAGSDLRQKYYYDEQGLAIGVKYNSNYYYYVKNVQGDITGILDNTLNQIVNYTYDSWRKSSINATYMVLWHIITY